MKSSRRLEFGFRLRKVGGDTGRVVLGQVMKNLTYWDRFKKYICEPNQLEFEMEYYNMELFPKN